MAGSLARAVGALARNVSPSRGIQAAAEEACRVSWFAHVDRAPRDPILGVTDAWKADPNPNKMNLGVGAYRDNEGNPVVLDVVREAEQRIAGINEMEYLPISGHKEFVNQSARLAYGDNATCVEEGRVAAIQSLSGTGACRIFAELVAQFLPGSTVYLPNPTWSNHHNIFREARVPVREYRYYNPATRGLDFAGVMSDLREAPEGAVVLLHACAHNPTGVDPTPEQWQEISDLMLRKQQLPFLDMAYQGFATGDCERDAQAVRTFVRDGHTIGLAQSFAKNMGLYGQRVGVLSLVCSSPHEATNVQSQMAACARPMYSNPPLHGALLVSTVLGDNELRNKWFTEVRGMASRIIDMRKLLRHHMESQGSQLNWEHITSQIGMFCYTGLTPTQVDELTHKHSIYLTRNGRISMAGVNVDNVERLSRAMHAVTCNA